MGMVWEASQKGVPFLGVPGNSLNIYIYILYTYITPISRLVHRPYFHDWLVKKKPAVSRPAKEISQGLADEGVL